MSVVGFDFGSESSVVAVARRRVIDVLQNDHGHRKTPSMVAYAGKQRIIGNDALAQYSTNYENSIMLTKRLLARHMDDADLSAEKAFMPFRIVPLENNKIGIEVSYNDDRITLTPEQITAAIFTKLRTIAEKGLDGVKVVDCVISVPHCWTDAQRRALLDAAHINGLNVLRLMNENTAVALNYGILRNLPDKQIIKVMFVDVGHSYTTATLASMQQGKLEILGTASDRFLGGRNFDQLLVNHFASYIKTKYNMDVTTSSKAMLKLWKECERIKKILSANQLAPFNVEYIMNDRDVSGQIERKEFDALADQELLPRLLKPIQTVLDSTKTTIADLASVEVVGGAVRIPCIQAKLKQFFGRDLSFTCDGDESVARGCVLQCAMLSPNFKVREFDVKDITDYAIDIAWGPVPQNNAEFQAESSTELFPVGNPIPNVKMISFADRKQPFMLIARYHDPSALPAGVDPIIGRFIISGMPTTAPPNASKAAKMKVKVKLDMNGILSVSKAEWLQDVKIMVKEEKKEEKKDEKKADEKTAEKMETESTSGDATASSPAAETAAPMETEAKDKDALVEKEVTERTTLKVESFVTGFNARELSLAQERETAMQNQDRVIAETNEKRNELESYILEMRNHISEDGDLSKFVNDADREKFNEALSEAESWLYGDGYDAQKSQYAAKLQELQVFGNPIKRRRYESETRGNYVSALKSMLTQYEVAASSNDEKYAHIEAAEKSKVLQLCGEISDWLVSSLSKQDRLKLSENPVITVQEIDAKRQSLENTAAPIMNKPKPQPKPEEKKAEEKPAKMDTEEAAAADAQKSADSQQQQQQQQQQQPNADGKMDVEQ